MKIIQSILLLLITSITVFANESKNPDSIKKFAFDGVWLKTGQQWGFKFEKGKISRGENNHFSNASKYTVIQDGDKYKITIKDKNENFTFVLKVIDKNTIELHRDGGSITLKRKQ